MPVLPGQPGRYKKSCTFGSDGTPIQKYRK